MNRLRIYDRSLKDILIAIGPVVLILMLGLIFGYKFVDPAPPRRVVISTGEKGANYFSHAQLYKEIFANEGIELEVRPSKGAFDNLRSLEDKSSGVDAGFVQDGLGSRKKDPDVSSLGSLYYEPIWIFYRGSKNITRISSLIGKKIGVGETGGETHSMAKKLLEASGVTEKDAARVESTLDEEIDMIKSGKIDAAFFVATADATILDLLKNPDLRIMSLDQAEAITRQFPYLHHVVLPHGTIDLKNDLPRQDVDLLAPTATLVVRNHVHPALIYLFLKAAAKVHHDPGLFEKKGEFPIDKDYVFPLNSNAKTFYKSGAPFWLRYLPFWLATLVERFLFLVIPLLAIIIPIIKMIPRFLDWRVKSRIYQRYGELKKLELEIRSDLSKGQYDRWIAQLDAIEDRCNGMKMPLDVSDDLYLLREHIHFVRERLVRMRSETASSTKVV